MKKAFTSWVEKNLCTSYKPRYVEALTAWAYRSMAHEPIEEITFLLEKTNIVYAGWFLRGIKSLIADSEENEEIISLERLLMSHVSLETNIRYALKAAFLFSSDYEFLYNQIQRYYFQYGSQSMADFASQLVDCIQIPGESDSLFISLRALIEFDLQNEAFISPVLRIWAKRNYSLLLPQDGIGLQSLSVLYQTLINGRFIPSLTALHNYFPGLKVSDIYKVPFDDLAVQVIQESPNDFEVYVFLQHAYEKEYGRTEGFRQWKELVLNNLLGKEDWFKRYVFLQHMKTACSHSTISAYRFKYDPNLFYKDVISHSTWTYLTHEIVSVFAQVLSDCPDYAYSFLEMIAPINQFRYRHPHMSTVKGTWVRESYATYAFFNKITDILADYYDLKDAVRIYINSPLHSAIIWTRFLEQLLSVYGRFDIQDTPFSRIAVIGFLSFDSDGEPLFCADDKGEELISLDCDIGRSILEELSFQAKKSILGVLEGYVPGVCVKLSSASILNADCYFTAQAAALQKKLDQDSNAVIQEYWKISQQGSFDYDSLAACAGQLDNVPSLRLILPKSQMRELSVAQVEAFLSFADRPYELKELIQYTNILSKGKINLFRDDPFGENAFRMDAEEYLIALKTLGKRSGISGPSENTAMLLAQKAATPEVVLDIYMNTVLKRMYTLRDLLYLLLRKFYVDIDLSSDIPLDQFGSLFYRIYTGKISYVDKESRKVFLTPLFFNRGTTSFEYIPPKKKFFLVNKRHYFIIDSFNFDMDTCRLKMVSTRSELTKSMPVHTFRCALLSEINQTYYINDTEIKKMLSVELGEMVFQEQWYLDGFRLYFNAHIESGQGVLDALEKLGTNNAFRDGHACNPLWFKTCGLDAHLYRDYLHRISANNRGVKIAEAIQVFWNSPIHGVIALEEVFDILTAHSNVLIGHLVAALNNHPIEATIINKESEEVEFKNIVCEHYEFLGNHMSQRFLISNYNPENKQVEYFGI